ncbi:MAG TPA: hypothetical protein VID73_00350 [Ktedonobacterales bacterium]
MAIFTWLRVLLLLSGWPALDSDEAIIGLMARHILRGARPAFYYGQHYLGALDAYIAAVFFAVLGPSTIALRLSMLPLVLGFLLMVLAIGQITYGKVGALAFLALAVGPAYALLREQAVIGGYQETLFLGGALLLLTYRRLRQPEPAPRTRAELWRAVGWYVLMGLVIGLGVWSDQLILPVVGAVLVALVAARPREALRLPGAALVAGAVVGGWPFLSYNLTHHFATFTELAAQNRVAGQVGPFPPLGDWLAQVGSILSVGLPAVLGSPRVCVVHGGTWPSYPPALVALGQPALSWCGALNTLFSLAVLALYGLAAAPLVRMAWRWWQARRGRAAPAATPALAPAEAAKRAQEHARLWLRAMLLITAAGTLLLYSLSKTAQLYQFTAARYLLPLYLTLPLVAGGLLQVERWAGARALRLPDRAPGAIQSMRQALSRVAVGWALMMPLPILAFIGFVATLAWSANHERFALPLPPPDRRIIATLEAHGVTTFVSDYWTCYRLAFESGERLRCAVRDSVNGTLTRNGAVNRYAPYLDEVLRAPHPAYVFPAGSSQDATFATWAAAQHLPHVGYARLVQDGQAIYYYPAHG